MDKFDFRVIPFYLLGLSLLFCITYFTIALLIRFFKKYLNYLSDEKELYESLKRIESIESRIMIFELLLLEKKKDELEVVSELVKNPGAQKMGYLKYPDKMDSELRSYPEFYFYNEFFIEIDDNKSCQSSDNN